MFINLSDLNSLSQSSLSYNSSIASIYLYLMQHKTPPRIDCTFESPQLITRQTSTLFLFS